MSIDETDFQKYIKCFKDVYMSKKKDLLLFCYIFPFFLKKKSSVSHPFVMSQRAMNAAVSQHFSQLCFS